jgi:hypothetical protein
MNDNVPPDNARRAKKERAATSYGAALDLQSANVFLGLSPKSNWLLAPDCPIARCDMRKPSAQRPLWRWRRETLEKFLSSREVAPGGINPQAYPEAWMYMQTQRGK